MNSSVSDGLLIPTNLILKIALPFLTFFAGLVGGVYIMVSSLLSANSCATSGIFTSAGALFDSVFVEVGFDFLIIFCAANLVANGFLLGQ